MTRSGLFAQVALCVISGIIIFGAGGFLTLCAVLYVIKKLPFFRPKI